MSSKFFVTANRWQDTFEALSNAVIGLVVSWVATFWLLPIWGLHPSASASAGISLMFFCISFARAFVLRRLFRGLA